MEQTFRTIPERSGDGLIVALPYDPDAVWEPKPIHHVRGTVGGHEFRGPLDGQTLRLGPAWVRDHPLVDEVTVTIYPEGPQWADLPPDFAAALEAEPEARVFFLGLATFYRKGWLTWLNGAKREPKRAARIAEIVDALRAGRKSR